MEGPPLGPGGEDITWPDQVAPRGRKASSTRKIKPQTSNLKPFIFHCLHCSPSCFDPDSLLLAYFWLGLSWIDCISANKSLSSSKTSSRKPYTNSKQQERQKHSAETTINLSGSRGSLSLRTGSNPAPYIQCTEYRHI